MSSAPQRSLRYILQQVGICKRGRDEMQRAAEGGGQMWPGLQVCERRPSSLVHRIHS